MEALSDGCSRGQQAVRAMRGQLWSPGRPSVAGAQRVKSLRPSAARGHTGHDGRRPSAPAGDELITSLRHRHSRGVFSSRRSRERDLAAPRRHREHDPGLALTDFAR